MRPPRQPSQEVRAGAVLVSRRGGLVLGARVPMGEVNEGQVELPGPGILIDHADSSDLEQALTDRYGCRFEVGERLAGVRHSITNHKITLSIYAAKLRSKASSALETKDPTDATIPWTTPSRKALQAVSR